MIRSFGDDLKLANLLPPIFICLVMGTIWSTYSTMHLLPLLQLVTPTELRVAEDWWRGIWQVGISQTLVVLLLTCYTQAVLTHPGRVPDSTEWKLGAYADLQNISPQTLEVKLTGERRHCKWCFKYKPDRCHHCRICKVCVLKMDHHCPWIMNCVGFNNHKYFFLLAIYSVLSCLFISVTVMKSVVASVDKDMPLSHRFLLVLCATLSVIMGTLMGVFLSFHAWLMLRGLTTIEFCEKSFADGVMGTPRKRSRYDRGVLNNVMAVLGPRPLLWLLPMSPPVGDGMTWTVGELGSAVATTQAATGPAGSLADSGAAKGGAEAGDPEWTSFRSGASQPQ